MPIIYPEPLDEIARWPNVSHAHPKRDTPEVAISQRREPNVPSYQPDHINVVAHPSVPMGDPFNARNIVHPGDVWTRGKIHSDPGTNLNLYTNIRGILAVAQKFWGFIAPTKVMYKSTITYPRGGLRPLGADVNIETPDSISYGEMATVEGHTGTTIKGISYA